MSIKYGRERLPSEYQEVKYIQSSGTQYIDTNVQLGTSNFELNIKCSIASWQSQEMAIASIWASSPNYWNMFITTDKKLDLYLSGHNTISTILQLDTIYEMSVQRTASNTWKLALDNDTHTYTYTPGGTNNTTLKLFTRGDVPGTSFSNTYIKMYSCELYVSGTLVRNFVPCYRKSDDVIGMYDLVNNVFYTNAGSGTFIKGNDIILKDLQERYVYMTRRLPAEYQEVEYIQSSGTQRIDTGYVPTTSTEFEIDYEIVSYIGQYATPFGTRYAHNDRAYYIGYENDNTSFYSFGSNKVDPSTVYFHGVGVRRNITYHNNVLSNGSQSVTVTTNQTPYGAIRIFCEEQNGNVQEYAAMKLYSFKLREGSTLTRDFVPCYRKSDSVIGLYDLVNDVFYTNAGTGTFTKGNDQDTPGLRNITEVYIGNGDSTATKIRPVGGLPYDNVYITNSGIYTGTDASPLTTQIKAATIYGAWYDREQNVIRMYTNNGVGWYDFNTDVITIVDSYTRTSIGGSMAFYGDYIVVQCGDSYVAIMDRATKTKTRTINIPSGTYTGCVLNSPYDQTCKYVILGLGYANKYVYDVTTGTQGSSWGNSYFQVRCFNDKVIKTCENSQYTAINISDAPNGAGSVTIESGTYKQQTTRIVDSGMLKRVTSDDFEYNTYFIGCSRSTTNTKLINVSTKSTIATLSTGNKNIQGQSIKYNSQYALCFGNGNNNANTNRLWKINRSDYSFTEITTGNGDRINILSSGNIAAVGKGIIGIDGTVVYSNSNFITAFSKDAYNG